MKSRMEEQAKKWGEEKEELWERLSDEELLFLEKALRERRRELRREKMRLAQEDHTLKREVGILERVRLKREEERREKEVQRALRGVRGPRVSGPKVKDLVEELKVLREKAKKKEKEKKDV